MIIDLMRHGEPVGGRRYRGNIDDPLSERGWQQMRAAVEHVSGWQVIVTSPLRRCAEFAAELAQREAIECHEEARFTEIGFGDWQGRTADEIRQRDAQQFQRFYQDPVNFPPPGAEGLAAFSERVIAGWDDLLQRYPDRHVLVVAHAGVMRAIIARVLNMPLDSLFRLQVSNAAISRIRLDAERGAMLLLHNGSLV